VKAKLAIDQRTRGMELEVEAKEGEVLVKGQLVTTMTPFATGTQRTKDYIIEIAKDIPGVKGLSIDLK
jgi:osmotically-inducible protein OsmY